MNPSVTYVSGLTVTDLPDRSARPNLITKRASDEPRNFALRLSHLIAPCHTRIAMTHRRLDKSCGGSGITRDLRHEVTQIMQT